MPKSWSIRQAQSVRSLVIVISIAILSYLYLSPNVLLVANVRMKDGPPDPLLNPIQWIIIGLSIGIAFWNLTYARRNSRLLSLGLGTIIGGGGFWLFSLHLGYGSRYLLLTSPYSIAFGAASGFIVALLVVTYANACSWAFDKLIQKHPGRVGLITMGFTVVVLGLVILNLAIGKFGILDSRGSSRPPLDSNYRLEPSVWVGTLQPSGQTYPFELVIQRVGEAGQFYGYIDWGPNKLFSVTGRNHGNNLEFEEKGSLFAGGGLPAPDPVSVWIAGDKMVGTAQGGFSTFRARRLETPPPRLSGTPYMSGEEITQRWSNDIDRCKEFGGSEEAERCWRGLAFRSMHHDFCYYIISNLERVGCVTEINTYVDLFYQ